MSLRFAIISTAIVMLFGAASGEALATEHVVKMLNDNGNGKFMVFEPDYIQAEPGDTVKFVAVDKFHNAETLPEIWPEGAAPFRGELSKDVVLKVEKEGVYSIKCLPHYPLGMMALVVVGDPVNAAQVSAFKTPVPAKKRFEAIAGKLPKWIARVRWRKGLPPSRSGSLSFLGLRY
jgi:pseudoazurin